MKKLIIKILLLSLLLTNYSFTEEIKFYNPSFNCTNVELKTIEYAICTNLVLSSLDVSLNDYYKKIKKNSTKYKAFGGIKVSQTQWLKKVHEDCNQKIEEKLLSCLQNYYETRVEELARVSQNYKIGKKLDEQLISYFTKKLNCQEIKSKMNSSSNSEDELNYAMTKCKRHLSKRSVPTQDCLYCGYWHDDSYPHSAEVYINIKDFVIDFSHRHYYGQGLVCSNVHYWIKEQISPITLIIETAPNYYGKYCIGRYVILDVRRIDSSESVPSSAVFLRFSPDKSDFIHQHGWQSQEVIEPEQNLRHHYENHLKYDEKRHIFSEREKQFFEKIKQIENLNKNKEDKK